MMRASFMACYAERHYPYNRSREDKAAGFRSEEAGNPAMSSSSQIRPGGSALPAVAIWASTSRGLALHARLLDTMTPRSVVVYVV